MAGLDMTIPDNIVVLWCESYGICPKWEILLRSNRLFPVVALTSQTPLRLRQEVPRP